MNQKKINLIESISVVLPSKNHEKLILENFYEFKQFLHDNFNEFEILIVSNGSSKENVNLLKNKISLDQSISIYETEIAGKGNAVKLATGAQQKQLSKEFVRQWLIENGFQGKDGQEIPHMSEDFCKSVSDRYIELFEHITGDKFVKEDVSDVMNRVEKNILNYLNN